MARFVLRAPWPCHMPCHPRRHLVIRARRCSTAQAHGLGRLLWWEPHCAPALQGYAMRPYFGGGEGPGPAAPAARWGRSTLRGRRPSLQLRPVEHQERALLRGVRQRRTAVENGRIAPDDIR
jgi:hypothetical protein